MKGCQIVGCGGMGSCSEVGLYCRWGSGRVAATINNWVGGIM